MKRIRRALAASMLALAGLAVAAAPSEATVPMPDGGPVYDRTAADQNTPITPEEALYRAEDWVAQGLPYSQEGFHPDLHGTSYRRDCSGFVSMAWHTDSPGFSTLTIEAVAHRIGWNEVQPGDAVNSFGHIALVERWEPGVGAYVMTFGTTPPTHSLYTTSMLAMSGYYPIRYNRMRIVTDEMVLDELRQRVQRPDVFIQPPFGQTLVNLETIFYADDTPYHETIPIGSVQVEVWATPGPFRWKFGDGTSRETPDGGDPFPNQTITHRYATADTFSPSVDVTWGGIRWQIVGDDEVHVVNETFTLQGEPAQLTSIESRSFLGER
jgi:hypothetical protein